MPNLRRCGASDLAAEASHCLTPLTTRRDYLAATGEVLRALLPADSIAWNDIGSDGRIEVVSHPFGTFDDAAVAARLAAPPHDHPAITSYLSDPSNAEPRRMSDLVTRTELLRTATYAEVLAPLNTQAQLTLLVARPGPSSLRGWAVNRSRGDFTDDEVQLARALQPALATLEWALISRPAGPVAPEAEAAARERFRLTDRELEVLRHLTAGLTADAIGRLLRISPRTVRKHLENAYGKLGAHDRLTVVQRMRQLGFASV